MKITKQSRLVTSRAAFVTPVFRIAMPHHLARLLGRVLTFHTV